MGKKTDSVVSIILAAGRGSRMSGYKGNKTLLPLIPSDNLFTGARPLLLEVLDNLPEGPKGVVINHCGDMVKQVIRKRDIFYINQPLTNGTGGALIAARSFLESVDSGSVLITMGDVPLIRRETYERLLEQLDLHDFVVLAFEPPDKAQYGLLEFEEDRLIRIVEWKYWHRYDSEKQRRLRYANAGVYASDRRILLEYLDNLIPHTVWKDYEGSLTPIQEYFITDLVELMVKDNYPVGMCLAPCEEVIGVDTPEALREVQRIYQKRLKKS